MSRERERGRGRLVLIAAPPSDEHGVQWTELSPKDRERNDGAQHRAHVGSYEIFVHVESGPIHSWAWRACYDTGPEPLIEHAFGYFDGDLDGAKTRAADMAVRLTVLTLHAWRTAADIADRWDGVTAQRVDQVAQARLRVGSEHRRVRGQMAEYSPEAATLIERELAAIGYQIAIVH